MSLFEDIDNQIKNAMRSHNTVELNVLRMLKNNINEKIKSGSELSDDLVMSVLQSEAKKRKEAIKIYQDSDETERAATEAAELAILSKYLPEEMNEEEVRKVVQAKIAQLGVHGPEQMGPVMGAVRGELANKADMALVASIVKEELSS